MMVEQLLAYWISGMQQILDMGIIEQSSGEVWKKEARIREGVEWEEQMLYFSGVSFSHCGLKSWRDD